MPRIQGLSNSGLGYLLPSLFKTLLLPPLLTYTLTLYLHVPVSLHFLLYLTSLPVLYILRTEASLHRIDSAARRAGALPIPRVKGRYPLNVDILLDWARSGSEEEVGRMMALLGREYGATYNTRVLGEDQVS
jgi:hypothetical protein